MLLLALRNPAVSSAQSPVAPPHPAASAFLWQHARADFESRGSHAPLGGFLGPDDEDYRYTGFFVGAGLAAATSFIAIGYGALDQDSCGACNFGGFVLATALLVSVLGLSGAVIGGMVRK
jgi:hypothetical protein